jgi:hypothetical protein
MSRTAVQFTVADGENLQKLVFGSGQEREKLCEVWGVKRIFEHLLTAASEL